MTPFREWRGALKQRLAEAVQVIDEAVGKPVRDESRPLVREVRAGLARSNPFFGIDWPCKETLGGSRCT